MAAPSFKRTEPVRVAKFAEQVTQDAIYWKQLEFPITVKTNAAVSHIEFSPAAPHDYAVTSSTKVQIFCHRTNQPIKSLTRFRQTAYCCSYRSDGQLLVAGSDEPVVRIFSGKKLLRELKDHTRPVHVTHFTRDIHRIFSASDDLTLKLWDVPSQEVVSTFSEHQDYIRCGAASPVSSDIIVTGSYDHRVKLWDVRSNGSVLTINHGHPVESVLVHPSGGLIISAGGNVVKVWDSLGGGRLLTQLSNHHKTVTALCMASDNRRLVTASLDSVAVAPGDDLVAVGMTDGLLSIQRRRDDDEIAAKEREKKRKKRRLATTGLSHSAFSYSGKPAAGDEVVERKRKAKMEKYDVCLRKFQYGKALDAAMDIKVRSREPEITISVVLELIRRGGISPALAGRDDESVSRMITFILKNLSQPGYVNTLLDLLSILLDLYKDRAEDMPQTREVVARVVRAVELSIDSSLERSGSAALCDLILSAAAPSLSNHPVSLSNHAASLNNHVTSPIDDEMDEIV